MDLSVIIVSWNVRDHLKRCIESLSYNSDFSDSKIYIVDNASSDGTEEMVKSEFPEVNVIQSGSNIGFSRGNNLALPRIESTYVLFLNPDTVVLENSLKNLYQCIDGRAEVGAVGARLVYQDGTVQPLGIQWYPTLWTEFLCQFFISHLTTKLFGKLIPIHDPEISGYVRKIYGGCVLVRKTVLDKVGSFDERFFMYVEDVDLCKRITESGIQIFYCAESTFVHNHGAASSRAPSAFATLMKCDSISKYMKKHHGNIGSALFRVMIFSSALIRLFAVLAWKTMNLGNNDKMIGSIGKYRDMLFWALHLKQPSIPE